MVDVVVLSVLQGIAEFLPISSSGHLILGRSALGLGGYGLRLDIFLHVGTLLAVFVFYRAIVRRLATGFFSPLASERSFAWGYALKILLSAIPVGLVGVLFEEEITSSLATARAVSVSLMVTGVILLATRFIPPGTKEVSILRACVMGLAQAIAIIPGISRSGMTLVAARFAKVRAEKAAEFSFLMSAPPIVGAALLEVFAALGADAQPTPPVPEVSWPLCFVGAVVSALVGYVALKFLLASLKSDKFWLFGPYALLMGLAAFLLI